MDLQLQPRTHPAVLQYRSGIRRKFRLGKQHQPPLPDDDFGCVRIAVRHGRQFLAHARPLAEALLGGWTTTAIYSYNSGNYLLFGQMDVVGNPNIDNPSKWGYMFNPAAFKQSASFTPRTNPWFYPGYFGPGLQESGRHFSQVLQSDGTLPAGVQDGSLQREQHVRRRGSRVKRNLVYVRPGTIAAKRRHRTAIPVQSEAPLLIWSDPVKPRRVG